MKSAYAILGIPGNASLEDIEDAYKRCIAHFPKERLAQDAKALDSFNEIADAYRMLRNAEFRAAYDRKLSGAVREGTGKSPRIIIEKEELPWFTKPLNVIAVALIALLASAVYFSYARNQERKAQIVRELAEQKRLAEEATLAQRRLQEAEAERARAQAENDRSDRQIARESSIAASIASRAAAQNMAMDARQADAERREALRREQQAKQEERQRALEAEQRIRKDKQTIRELCYQNYGRSNC